MRVNVWKLYGTWDDVIRELTNFEVGELNYTYIRTPETALS